MPCKITLEHVRRNEARIVCKGGYFQAEWSPPWTQLRIPDAPQRKDDKGRASQDVPAPVC